MIRGFLLHLISVLKIYVSAELLEDRQIFRKRFVLLNELSTIYLYLIWL